MTTMVRTKLTAEDRLERMTNKLGPKKLGMKTRCWLFTGTLTKPNKTSSGGYGLFYYEGKLQLAHRAVYKMHGGYIPPKMQIDHRCNTTNCIRRSHLRVVTPKFNSSRRRSIGFAEYQKAKTHCPQGHLYSKENTFISNKNGRGCRKCRTAFNKTYVYKQTERSKKECKRGHLISEVGRDPRGRCQGCYKGSHLRLEYA